MTRIPKNISFSFLALFLISFLIAHSSEFLKSLSIFYTSSPALSSKLNPQETNLTITPGLTKKLTISLKGSHEEITFELEPDKTESSIVKFSTILNGQTESSSFLNFFQPEMFNIFLDYQAKQCVLSGDKGFSMTKKIEDAHYDVFVDQEWNSGIQNISSLIHSKDPENLFPVVCCILGTFIGVIMLGMVIGLPFKRRKTINYSDLPVKAVTEQRIPIKCCVTERTEKPPVFSQHKKENANPIKIHEDIISKDCEGGLLLEMDETDEDEGNERRMPTAMEIKALVREMEENGTLCCEFDPSEDTDDEDQYQAPILPNYFCCMVCFEGTRCAVVEPCRHVFACEKCVEQVLRTHKNCRLCMKSITTYEHL